MTEPLRPAVPGGVRASQGGAPVPADHAPRSTHARSVARLRALADVGRAGVGLSQRLATRQIITAAMRACDADSASLGVWVPDQQILRITLNVGDLGPWEEEVPENEVYEADQGTWLATMADGSLGSVLSLDDPTIDHEERDYLLSLGKHSSISVPLLHAGSWWGELYVARTAQRPAFAAADIDWVSAVAAQVSAALEAVEHAAKVEVLAQTDPMTGLANRRALNDWLEGAMRAWRERQVPIGLAVVDLNRLKQINDDQGHDAGDRVLRQLAEILHRSAARFDKATVARLGGDEFCVAVSGFDAPDLVDAAHQLCSAGWELLPHGIACGVVITTDAVGAVEMPARLLRLADAAQYRAKRLHSRLPVVAGRVLTAEQAVSLTEVGEPATPDRRTFRGREGAGLGHLIDAALRALDQTPNEPVRARLGLVAELLTHHVDGVGWWLSVNDAGSSLIRTVDFSVYRQPPTVDPDEIELEHELMSSFPLDSYPLTRLALAGGSFQVSADDPTSDPAEVAILDGLGADAVLAAGATDDRGDGWLVEIFLDELSGRDKELAGVLRLLVLAALHRPVPL